MRSHRRAVQIWITYAMDDLETAEILIGHDPVKINAAAFHCQQAAEKYLKAFLVFHGRRPPRTHSLEILLQVAEQYDESLSELLNAVLPLAPFAVGIRYPDLNVSATVEDANLALKHACEIRDGILTRLDLD